MTGPPKLHRLLNRQLARRFGDQELSDELLAFVQDVDAAYRQADGDRNLLERSLDLTSQELGERNEELVRSMRGAGVATWSWSPIARTWWWQGYPLPYAPQLEGRIRQSDEELFARIGPDHRERVAVTLATTFEEGHPIDLRFPINCDDGVERWLALRGSRRSGNGAIGICVDVTAEVNRLRESQQAQKMETLGLLAGGIAHDLNNLLSPIVMVAELLSQDLAGDANSLEMIEMIQSAAFGARDMVSQLLAFSRKQILQVVPCDLNEELTRLTRLLRRTLGAQIKIELDLGSIDPVRGDVSQLQQVFLNLAINARDAMPRGGQLRIVTRQDADQIVVDVSDTGTGIPPELLACIFEPFFTTKAVGCGTGLGLATVFGIVQQHGGRIQVASKVDHGTTFTVHLPRDPRSLSGTVSSSGIAAGQPATILVVEDDASVRGLVCRLLERDGHRVLTSGDPLDAIAIAATVDEISLLVADVVMPHLNGRQLFETIARSRPRLKVVYISGYTADVLAPGGILEPGVRLLAKPFSAHALSRAVRGALAAS